MFHGQGSALREAPLINFETNQGVCESRLSDESCESGVQAPRGRQKCKVISGTLIEKLQVWSLRGGFRFITVGIMKKLTLRSWVFINLRDTGGNSYS